jgi:hypothetical protein
MFQVLILLIMLQLDFWSVWFYINPTFMIGLGIFTFSVSVYGFLISNQENRLEKYKIKQNFQLRKML